MKRIILTILGVICLVKTNATDLSLYEKTALISEKYLGIRQRIPKGYTRENLKEFVLVNLNCNSEQLKNHKPKYGYAYYEFADSKDGESKLLYPFFPYYPWGKTFYLAERICHSKKPKGRPLVKYRQHKAAD